ncbi:hypothetical protein HPK19_03185 [Arthrobacter citreus]|nr:hypothetical protein HPK19_03185 [Arthrobacter citreus]
MSGFDKNNRDPEVEWIIDMYPEEKDIYRYMRNQYEHFGENYNADIHDIEVAKLASIEFNITAEKAGDLYSSMECRIHEFQNERLKRMKSK